MSIPPLVCNTPPPPEQCDDDRDGEDFDIQYNLSQEEEDEGQNYNYGKYSDYIYPTSTSSNIHQDLWSSNISKKTDNKQCSDLEETKNTESVLPKSDSCSVNQVAIEEIVLEDLNLKLEEQNDEASLEQNANQYDTETFEVDCSNNPSKQFTHVLEHNEDSIQYTVSQEFNESPLTDEVEESLQIKTLEKNEESSVEEIVDEEFIQEEIDSTEENDSRKPEIGDITADDVSHVIEPTKFYIQVEEHKDLTASELNVKEMLDDDFGDFDDFQFISSEGNPLPAITHCDNPWKNEISKNSDFGNFTATFDVNNTDFCKNNDNFDKSSANANTNLEPLADESDDFGDFDDFKSSFNDHKETPSFNSEPSHNVPNLSLYPQDSEIQLIESINSVLSCIFTSEISEHEGGFMGKLQASLNETWGHLVDTDIRQSYIVNWNNSLGQKSLLKALCIDSRNILFGPKWNNNMPKYAANLTVAPLQPQKPVTPTNTNNTDERNVDKAASKETSTWTDPFTSDGQESCNTENESTATLTRPENLDVFSKAMSPEMGHLYSTTLPVQPIRQINLPDTHIFTPTDSETPRSKTIHYDQAPAMLVPQPTENNRQIDEFTTKNEAPVQSLEDDEEYWEFQDFKGANSVSSKVEASSISQDINTTPITNISVAQNITTFEYQILQPIKIEPVTPALNWPAPGEVKEAFDDFSEYISNTPWSNENSSKANQAECLNCKQEGATEILEDDFETFQSAPAPAPSTVPPMGITYPTTANLNYNFSDFPQNFIDTSDTLHTANSNTGGIISKQIIQNDSSLLATDTVTILKDRSDKTSPILSSGNQSINANASILQPSISSTSTSQRNHQKTGQILQPLSLESYSQINWPSPGIDLQDLSRFNPVESLQSLKTDSTGSSKLGSPAHKDMNTVRNEISDDDIWGDFVSSKPKPQQTQPKKVAGFADDDEWTDFVSSPSVKPQNGLNTISLNVHTNLNMQKNLGPNKFNTKNNQLSLDIPTLKYVTPKSSGRGLYNEKHFQNL